jgi:hypothetical protein
VALNQWMRVINAVGDLAQLSGRSRKPDSPASAAAEPPSGPLGQLETRLAGVLVAALKEAFDRDRARLDLERSHVEAEQARAEAALRAELRRQSIDRTLGQIRLVAIAAVAVWMLSAALSAIVPGMRGGTARVVLGAGWLCAIGALGCAFAAWQRVGRLADELAPASASAARDAANPGVGIAAQTASWLLLGAIALSGASLLVAL